MSSKREKLYERAGIKDLAEFYRVRYASPQLLDARYFDPLNRFDIRWSRTMWVYDNVRRNSLVLDVGCGAGVLALLKRKDVTLVGADISADCAAVARRNGYDAAYAAPLTALPFPDATFDYVISLDVMGHIEFAEKDACLAEIKRVLKPDGVTMHGIECMNPEQLKDYDEMTDEELRRWVSVDGHVGMETEAALKERFSRFFAHVETRPRYRICQPGDELTKLADEYGVEWCDPDFLDYLRGLSFGERRAFNMAMGCVFERLSEHGVKLPSSCYAYVKASPAPLGDFYREHYDRSDLFPKPILIREGEPVLLNDTTKASFDGGWYEAEDFPPVARWMGKRARIRFQASPFRSLRLEMATHIPDVNARPLGVEFLLNGKRVGSCSLVQSGWTPMNLDVCDVAFCADDETGNFSATSRARLQDERDVANMRVREFELEIRADRTWQPCSTNAASPDDRELSVALCNIQIVRGA